MFELDQDSEELPDSLSLSKIWIAIVKSYLSNPLILSQLGHTKHHLWLVWDYIAISILTLSLLRTDYLIFPSHMHNTSFLIDWQDFSTRFSSKFNHLSISICILWHFLFSPMGKSDYSLFFMSSAHSKLEFCSSQERLQPIKLEKRKYAFTLTNWLIHYSPVPICTPNELKYCQGYCLRSIDIWREKEGKGERRRVRGGMTHLFGHPICSGDFLPIIREKKRRKKSRLILMIHINFRGFIPCSQ